MSVTPCTAEHSASLIERTRNWFSSEGPLGQTLGNYRVRDEQIQMAETVGRALQDAKTLIVEAGTGTGKSLAYLVPAMLFGGKVIVSTGTKNLQDQLYNKDIPLLLGLMKNAVTVSLLKGRANYLCLHRLKQAQEDPKLIRMRSSGGQSPWLSLRSLHEWGLSSEDGDLNANDVPAFDPVPLARVTSTTENCLGSDCPDFADCFVVKARRRAQEADVVVVNHHLLLADLALREEGFAELLPDADAVILDEAHQLPQIASQFFGRRYSYLQLADIARDLRAELRDVAGDMPDLKAVLGDYEEACASLLHRLQGYNQRITWSDASREKSIQEVVAEFAAAVEALSEALEPARVRSKGLEQASRRMKELSAFFADLQAESDLEQIRWLERTERGFVLHLTPLDVAANFRQIMQATQAAWIMTSATLSVDGGFEHFASQVGAEDAESLMLESPFDFESNALLYLPDIQHEPSHPAYMESLASSILPAIKKSAGGAFVLCTSLQAVSYLASDLRNRLDMHVLAQGEAPKQALLDRFRADGNAVLVGTSSFWEGVDVRGQALRLVIIDKLPFAHPGDPVMKARLEAIKAKQGNPFFDYQVPQAVISLKQGVGRLIRDYDDRGVVMLCDPRVTRKSYGRQFLSSLPAMPQSRDFSDVEHFMAEMVKS